MTGTREPQQDGSIQAMLRDSGLEAAAELRGTLEQLQALVPEQAPAPRADLAALLAAGSRGVPEARTVVLPLAGSMDSGAGPLPAGVTSLADRRRGTKRRLAVVGGAVVGAMALGAGAVAASSEDFRDSVHHTVGIIFQNTGGTPDVAPKHAPPSPSDIPAAPVPGPAAPAGTAPAAGSTPEVTGPGAASPAASAPGATPPAVGRGGVLPTPPQRPVTPGFPGIGDGRSLPANPIPEPTLPGVVPTKLPGQP
jgi:hypothetical protein